MTPAPASAGVPAFDAGAGLSRTVLSNGLTVVSEHVPGVRSAAIGAWVRSASVHETPAEMGVSHMLEHLVFKGTERRNAREIASSLESLGGSLDAYTAREHTAFQARVLDEHLAQAADVLLDIVFHPLLREPDMQLERKVILEEIAMVDDTPDDFVFEAHNAEMWGGHPYGYSILGTRQSVTEMPLAGVRALHERAYVPGNVVVSAAGNVEHDKLVDVLAAAGWAALPAGAVPPERRQPVSVAQPSRRHIARDSTQAHIVLGSQTVPHGDPRRQALVLVDTVLGGGMSSRLFQRVREELALAYSVYAFQQYHCDTGVHGIYAGTAPESAMDTLDAITDELARLAEGGITPEELESGKQQIKGQLTLSMESVGSRMYRAAAAELFREPWKALDDLLAEVDAVTIEDARAVCHEYFVPGRQTIVRLGPS
ncbi:MAG: insulinase family protein [Gemmatimonadaceae bacterium]|nr:insulinase family protein [Gemmatimonadaceae bacterium]